MHRSICLALVIVATAAAASASAQGQGQGLPTQNVNVVNTPSVNVVNTPSVNVANMPTVNLAITTQKIFDASLTSGALTNPIDVAAFKQIRVVARCFDAGSMTVTTFAIYGQNPDFDVAALGELSVPCNSGASVTYASPGQTIRLHVPSGSGRVVVYGRAN